MHHRNIQFLLEPAFYLKALRSLDIFKVDTAESRRNGLYRLNKLCRILLIHLDIKNIDTSINLEKESFTLHYGLSAKRSYISEAEYSCTIRYYSNKVALVSIFICILRILLDFKTWFRYARGICERKVCLSKVWFGRNDLYLTGTLAGMIIQCVFFCDLCHSS